MGLSPTDGSTKGLSRNVCLFGSGIIQRGVVAILRCSAEVELGESNSGLQGTRNAFSSITSAAGRVAVPEWSWTMAIGKSFHSICIMWGLAPLGRAGRAFL